MIVLRLITRQQSSNECDFVDLKPMKEARKLCISVEKETHCVEDKGGIIYSSIPLLKQTHK
jgi:hypothetical protein